MKLTMSSSLETAAIDTIVMQTKHVFSRLPDELVLAVFMHVEFPNRFSRVNKKFHEAASDSLHIAKWLECRYYRSETIWYALLHLGDSAKPLFDILLQRGADCPNWLLYQLVRDTDRVDGLVRITRDTEEIALRVPTIKHLRESIKRHRKPAGHNGGSIGIRTEDLSIRPRVDFPLLLRNYQPSPELPNENDVDPQLLLNRCEWNHFLDMYGSPTFSRASAVDYATVILQRGHDVAWRFEVLKRKADFPSLSLWSFFKPVCIMYLGFQSSPNRFQQLQGESGIRPGELDLRLAGQSEHFFIPTVARYLLQQNEVGLHRYGYAVLDGDSSILSHLRTSHAIEIPLIWKAFLAAIGRPSAFKEMVTRLLCSYAGVRLEEEPGNFQACYFRYIDVQNGRERGLQEGLTRTALSFLDPMASSLSDCSLYVRLQGRINALWLVLHIKNKITIARGRDPVFIQSRITLESVVYLLSYPWLSLGDLEASLKLTCQRFKQDNLAKVLQRAVEMNMQNAYCGMHLVKLAGKLDNSTSVTERLITPSTLDSILLYPEIDDGYSEDPLVAGLQGYRLDLPTRKSSYSDMGPGDHLPLALGILEVIKDRTSPAVKLLLRRAGVKKLNKIVQAYEAAGVCDA